MLFWARSFINSSFFSLWIFPHDSEIEQSLLGSMSKILHNLKIRSFFSIVFPFSISEYAFCDIPNFSAKEIQRQLGHKRYAPIWHMVHKLRAVMGKRDEQYVLAGAIELDEGFFSTEIPEEKKQEKLKRGRGSQKKTKVLVMAESQMIESPKEGKKPKRVGYLKMKVIDDLKAKTIDEVVQNSVSEKSTLHTDDSTSYVNLHGFVESRQSEVIPKDKIGEKLPWVHIAISNAKRQLLNSYHNVKPEFLQAYLDEFCYKFNRRYFGEALFRRLLVASVTYKNEFRYKYG